MRHTDGPMRPRLLRKQDGNLDHEILDLLFGFMDSFKNRFHAATQAHGLSLPLGHLLFSLHEPVPMRDVAAGMGYDASHITALVDQLEDRHLVERRADPVDRRVKRVALTEGGLELRTQLEDELLATLLPLDRLSADQRVLLRDLLVLANAVDVDEDVDEAGDDQG